MMGLKKDEALMVAPRKEAEKMFTDKVGTPSSELVRVMKWMPILEYDGGTELWFVDELKSDLIHFAPVIKDVTVSWCFDRRYLEDAYRLLDMFDKYPVFLSAKIVSPLWIETEESREKRKDDDTVILIAPRISKQAEEEML